MDAVEYTFETCAWPPPEDRRDRRFYLFGFDADGQPYIVKWCDRKDWQGWLAISLDDHDHNTAEPIVHAIEGANTNKLVKWSDAPLRWSTLGHGPDKVAPGGEG